MQFQPGNKIGNRFPPGQSGNPAGRPPKDPMTHALKARFEAEPDLLNRLIETGITKAIEGDFRFWKEIWDRLDGKVRTAEPEEPEVIDWSELDNEGDTARPSGRYVIDYVNQPEPQVWPPAENQT